MDFGVEIHRLIIAAKSYKVYRMRGDREDLARLPGPAVYEEDLAVILKQQPAAV